MRWRVLLSTISALIASASTLSAQPVITELQPRGAQHGSDPRLTTVEAICVVPIRVRGR